MSKIKVNDRFKFKVIDDESRLISPEELQKEIDQAISEVKDGKAFVRPSGTEDVLRLYAEAADMDQVKQLQAKITSIIDTKYSYI